MKPFVIAHRGASLKALENTLVAFDRAYTEGADGIELDIHLTADGHLVVVHNGEGIRESKLPDIPKHIPTLEAVFDNFGNQFKIINIEIKSTGFKSPGIEENLSRLITRFKIHEKIIVSSFNPLHLIRMKKIAPTVKRGMLIENNVWITKRNLWPWITGASAVNCHREWLSAEKIEHFRKKHREIWVWTVDDPEEMKKWIALRVNAIITNDPGKLRALLSP